VLGNKIGRMLLMKEPRVWRPRLNAEETLGSYSTETFTDREKH